MSVARRASSPKPEYQHFVPQFMVRNFAHKYNGPKQQRGKKKDDKMYRGELVVNNTKVKRILGIYDMYQDTSAPTKQQRRIETMFGELESRASASKEQGVWFLFLLKYRSSEGYNSNDKERLHAYMREKGFKRPVDVWFQSIQAIIEVDMDPEGNWARALPKQMYSDDAVWFFAHVQGMYMAICTPSDPEAEFILTDNSYGIFEGPNTFSTDETGKTIETGWTNFHEFAPLSPKLMIILRSGLLPNPDEDGSQRIREEKESLRKMAVEDWYGTDIKSMLADLPIAKPQLLPGEDGKRRKSDRFCFRFFPVSTEHVNRINLYLFDNAQRCRNITLEWYMTTPVTRKLLQNLAELLKALGSTKEPVWTEVPLHPMSAFDQMDRLLHDAWMMFEDIVSGSRRTIARDLEQAQRMLTLRIKIEVWSKGIPEHIRAQARKWLIESYLEGCPSRTVLHYLKRVRLMILYHDKEGRSMKGTEIDNSKVEGGEDVVAECAHHLTTRTKLNWLMYRTCMNDVEKTKDPIFDPWAKVPQGMEGALHLAMAGKFVLDVPGIAVIDELALTQEKLIRNQGLHNRREFHNPFFEDEEKIEVLTRVMARAQSQEVLRNRMEAGLAKRFEQVLFKITYPAPPIRLRV
ncbi:hypothetical protein GGR53DRAFT_523522 [Hypoxylon sp. FL1150]|nr:hypothetical protein GGR53DRAFT_523522 [Hypoxylon sp. FL1150]